MTTQKQIEANRQNALLSKGAVTEEGKVVVSKNIIKHGIFTQDLIFNQSEDKEDYEEVHYITMHKGLNKKSAKN